MVSMTDRDNDTEAPIYPTTVAVDRPNEATIEFLSLLDPRPTKVAEIGVYRGHTSKAIADILGSGGELHLFDFNGDR